MSDRNAAGSKYAGTRVGTTITNKPSPYGIGVDSTGDGVADRIDLGSVAGTDDLAGTVNGITVISRVMVDTGTLTSIAPRLIDKSNGGTGANGWWFGIDSSLRPNFQVNSGTGFLGTGLTQGVWSTIGVSAAQGGAPSFYTNGRFDTVGGSSVTFPNVTTNAAIANWNHTTDRQWDGQINYVFVWNRQLSAEEHKTINDNPWQVFRKKSRSISIPVVASGATTISGNPITWQWENNNVVAKEKIEVTPTDWQWFAQTGTIKEYSSGNPIVWQWETTTGSIQEGATTTITGNPISWEWQSGTTSFVQKIDGTPVNWEWQETTGEITENINATPTNWEWQTTTGQILGTDTIDTNPISWEWEVSQGNVVYLQPQQVSGTIGGKKDKKVKLPYYEGKDYESRIEVDEPVRDDGRRVADLLDVHGDVVRNDSIYDGKLSELDIGAIEQTGILVGDLVQGFAPKTPEVSVIEFPQVAESEGFDEEAAVIMLLLAA